MSERAAKFLDEALAFSPAERIEIADGLVASLAPPDDERVLEHQLEEVKDRLEAYRRGEIDAIPAKKAIQMAMEAAEKRSR